MVSQVEGVVYIRALPLYLARGGPTGYAREAAPSQEDQPREASPRATLTWRRRSALTDEDSKKPAN